MKKAKFAGTVLAVLAGALLVTLSSCGSTGGSASGTAKAPKDPNVWTGGKTLMLVPGTWSFGNSTPISDPWSPSKPIKSGDVYVLHLVGTPSETIKEMDAQLVDQDGQGPGKWWRPLSLAIPQKGPYAKGEQFDITWTLDAVDNGDNVGSLSNTISLLALGDASGKYTPEANDPKTYTGWVDRYAPVKLTLTTFTVTKQKAGDGVAHPELLNAAPATDTAGTADATATAGTTAQ
jgi:hypothetical protein